MVKTYKLKDLDCANCAAKMENGIAKLKGVQAVSVNFMAQKMTLEAPDAEFEGILKEALRVIKKTEPDCEVLL